METLHQLFASLDIFSALFKAFPAIINPVLESFQHLFMLVFTSLKHIVSINPGLICGTVFMSLVYYIVTTISHLRKIRA